MAANSTIKVAALCGSLRKASFNRGLIRSSIEICNESIPAMRMEEVGIAPLPLLNTDLEIEGTFPASVEAFRRKILDFDSFLFASPEYNYSISGLGLKRSKCLGRQACCYCKSSCHCRLSPLGSEVNYLDS